MSELKGKVALVTGAGRGMGRAHAVTLAKAGADVAVLDIRRDIESVGYSLSGPDDLAETARQVEALGSRALVCTADTRDRTALEEVAREICGQLGRIDIVIANAGISAMRANESASAWDDVIGVNLTGTFNTVDVVVPRMIEQGDGGVVILIGSTAALTSGFGSSPSAMAYVASKHGLVGLMRSYAANLGQFNIRVNAVHPTGVNTPMATSQSISNYIKELAATVPSRSGTHVLPVDRVEPQDVADAVGFLCSNAARFITGVNLPVDAGYSN